MNGSTASASAEPAVRRAGPRDLVVSVNWIGDAIMAMPALQVYRRLHPDRYIVVLARGVTADLWALHAAPDEVIRYDRRPSLRDPLFDRLRGAGFETAWILPNSFRSAWIPFRAGIPNRVGTPGGFRRPLLTRLAPAGDAPAGQEHQAWETMRLLNPGFQARDIPHPEIRVGDDARGKALERHGPWPADVIGMIPGAARGPSKRWPEEHFIQLAGKFAKDGFEVALFGGGDDAELCGRIAAAVPGCRNLAGRTTLAEWAALLAACRLVVANDSGGMHLAAALGRPVVALYGITDPVRTGPLGRRCLILQKSAVRSRDVPRNSEEARKSLAAIRPGEVYEASQPLLRTAGTASGTDRTP